METGFRGWGRRVGAGGGEVEGGARDEVCAPRQGNLKLPSLSSFSLFLCALQQEENIL